MKTKEVDVGAASIFITLSKGNITVKHGSDKAVLHQVVNAQKGSWDKIWDAIRKIKSVK